jgi:predicted outer membrane repeat protein
MRGTISNNSALHSGGGIYSTGTLRIEQAYIQNNRTTERATDNGGGGVFGTQVTLRTTVLRDNSSASQGGGLYVNAPSTLTVNGTSITGNYAQLDGGGVFYRGPMLSLSNATLSGNEAQLDVSQQQFGRGGGLHLAGVGQWAITEATVISNHGFGGGLSVVDSGPGWMQNTIMANNFAVNCTFGPAALIPGGTGNLIDDRSCQLSDAANLIDVEPWLGPLSYDKSVTGYHLPLPGSLALDALGAIPGTGCLSPVDQRGWDRPIDANNDGVARCDIGAVERQGFDPSATPTPARPTPIATPKPGSTLTSTPNPPIPPVPTFVTE